MFPRQFSLSSVSDVVLSFSQVHFLSFNSAVVPPRSFINSPCLLFPMSFFLFLKSIFSVFCFRCRCLYFLSPFSLSLNSTVVPPVPSSILPVSCFSCRSFSFLSPFSLSLVSAVVLSLSQIHFLCL